MKRSTKPSTTPGKVISPLAHTHEPTEISQPGEKLGPLNQDAPQATSRSAQKSAKERLEKAPRDKREITIGPTTKTGPDITID